MELTPQEIALIETHRRLRAEGDVSQLRNAEPFDTDSIKPSMSKEDKDRAYAAIAKAVRDYQEGR